MRAKIESILAEYIDILSNVDLDENERVEVINSLIDVLQEWKEEQ